MVGGAEPCHPGPTPLLPWVRPPQGSAQLPHLEGAPWGPPQAQRTGTRFCHCSSPWAEAEILGRARVSLNTITVPFRTSLLLFTRKAKQQSLQICVVSAPVSSGFHRGPAATARGPRPARASPADSIAPPNPAEVQERWASETWAPRTP